MKTFFISLFYIIIHSRYDTYSFYSYQIFQKIPSSDTSEIFQNLAIFFSRSKSHPSKKKKKFPIVFTFVLANLDTNDRNKNLPLYPRYSKKKKKNERKNTTRKKGAKKIKKAYSYVSSCSSTTPWRMTFWLPSAARDPPELKSFLRS